MNNKTQMNRIEKQLILYKRYLKDCKIQYVGKLCVEIAKLEMRLKTLRTMNDKQIEDKVCFQYIIVQSKANKLRI